MKLENGADICNLYLVANDDEQKYFGVVLADVSTAQHAQFVTWRCDSRNGETINTYWGNYFPDYGEAVRDFFSRCLSLSTAWEMYGGPIPVKPF
jgi:hypothetical protein